MGSHLLKAGSKRRRTQAEMKDQLEIEELSQVIDHDREDEIKKLSQSLASAEEEAKSNSAATAILRELIEKGVIRQEADGTVVPLNGPNIIGNQADMEL